MGRLTPQQANLLLALVIIAELRAAQQLRRQLVRLLARKAATR